MHDIRERKAPLLSRSAQFLVRAVSAGMVRRSAEVGSGYWRPRLN
jgi:hypothetical protein